MADERRVLNKETVKADMLGELKFPIIVNVVGTLLFCGFLALALVMIRVYSDTYIPKFAVALASLVFLALALFFLEVALEWYVVIEIVYIAKKGTFEIVEDKLERMSEHEFWESDYFIDRLRNRLLGRFRQRFENVFYFSKYGRVPGYSKFSMSGDTFYLVIIPSKDNKVIRTYPAKIYRYEKDKF